jgi:hypothetical protein
MTAPSILDQNEIIKMNQDEIIKVYQDQNEINLKTDQLMNLKTLQDQNEMIKMNQVQNQNSESKSVIIPLNSSISLRVNNLLQYIYMTLREYPPPPIVIPKCKLSSNVIAYKLYKSISMKLNIDIMKVVFICNKYSNQQPNLILTAADFEKLKEYDIIPMPKIDFSTHI